MCGRFTRSKPVKVVAELFKLPEPPEILAPRYNIKPGESVAVVAPKRDRVTRGMAFIRWGLVPWWSQDGKEFYINAMAETVHEKPSFCNAFHERRCLVPTDGFYEPLKPPGAKKGNKNRQWFFRLKSDETFAFAGLWETWKKADGETLATCCIITTKPNELVGAVHERQPVILRPDLHDAWLDADTPDDELRSMLTARSADEMTGWEVNREFVCDPTRDGPECLEPAA
jgi:putative SOS response-associated peptidase YedK